MLNFEYVMSAMAMTRIVMKYDHLPFYPEYTSLLEKFTQESIKRLEAKNKHTTSLISCLYNGFTEADNGELFASRNKNGCNSLYADSGGLQIITAGKSITQELKKKVYRSQAHADYAFCFDTIPLKSISAVRTSSERSNTANKLFSYDELEAAAKQTARDVIEQLSFFEKSGTNTKGMLIVQGNTWKDMVEWFSWIEEAIPSDLKSRIAGIATADTCMGNGPLESVEMIRAIKTIHDRYGPQYTNHVHLLGVGSISRMTPAINLIKSGYVDFIGKLSYDSTSHTSSAYMGKLFEDGKHTKIPKYRNALSEQTFEKIYQRHSNVFEPVISFNKYMDCVFSKDLEGLIKSQTWDTSNIIKYVNEADNWETAAVKLIPYAFVLHAVENFMTSLDEVSGSTATMNDPISILSKIKTEADMDMWFTSFASKVKSKRISRQLNTLDAFFGD